MVSDLTKKFDGNSLASIGNILNAKFSIADHRKFHELRLRNDNKVIGILTGCSRTGISRESFAHRKNIVECYLAYDSKGNYLGGLESLF